MTRTSRTRLPIRSRTTGRLLVAAAVVATAAASAPAFAGATTADATSAPPSRSGTSGAAYERVADFYGAYIDAVTDQGTGRLADELRNFYLTKGLRVRLAKWEEVHHADGVLRAQDVPRGWEVTPSDSGMGHTWSRVRLTWGSVAHPTYTYLTVQQDLATKKISGIEAGE
ncbi:hypothetical protein OK074_0735 [Actinobacteria bacterium OK074]|nr:hypothetical protein OK074_0735 [Actinobacteria bacterium OK074]